MKILITFLVLFFSSSLMANDVEKCADMADKAKTEYGAKLMLQVCLKEIRIRKTNFFNRSKHYKCAKKAYKLNNEYTVRAKFKLCMK